MYYKLKSVVVFFKVLTCLLISRLFGNKRLHERRNLSQASLKYEKRNQRSVLDPYYHGSLFSHRANFPSKYNIQAAVKIFKPSVFIE